MEQDENWSDAAPLSTQIRGSEKKSVTNAWLGLLLPIIMSLFFFGWGHMPFFMGAIPNPIACIIVLIAVFMLGRIVWETIRLKRFGDPILELTHVPVPLGGVVEGQIALGAGLPTAPDFHIKLQCIRRELRQSGKNDRWVETVLWTDEKTTPPMFGGMIPVSIPVPPEQEESDSDDPFNQILWRLTVSAPFRGPSFFEKYEIPIVGHTPAAQAIAEAKEQSGASSLPGNKPSILGILVFIIFGLAAFSYGVYLLAYGVADIQKAHASATWPTAEGQVQESTPPRGDAYFVNWNESDFRYSFKVGGNTYAGHTIYPHLLWKRTFARNLSDKYSRKSSVTVSYSPEDPTSSCLVPGLSMAAFQRLVLALMIMTVGVLFGGSGALAPRDAVITGRGYTFRAGTLGSKLMGYSFLLLIVLAVVFWWIT